MLGMVACTAAGCGSNGTGRDIAETTAETGDPGQTTATEDGEAEILPAPGGEIARSGEAVPDDAYRTSYEIFVWSFCDSDGDGIGDINGIRNRLNYINDGNSGAGDDLECTELWLTPVFPSPTYHKYDVTDYEAIDPQFGTMEDYEALLSECHGRGIRVLMDLPFNHTSSEHPWFQTAAQYLKTLPEGQDPDEKECPYFDYYNFTKEPADGYAQLEGTDWYYEARFWSGMPDLNLDCAEVRREIADILSFWQGKGVDGFRLDAVTSYYTENAQATSDFLQYVVNTAKGNDPDCYLVGEAWEDQSAYAKLYATGIDSLFDFRFAGQDGIIAGTVRGNRKASYYAEALEKEESLYRSMNPGAVNAPFYTNHDMARSAGYYTKKGESRVKLAQALNLLQTGNAFLYYGEEIGMKGSGKDENKRAPMYWTAEDTDTAAGTAGGGSGMCQGPPDMDDVAMKYPPLDEQLEDERSILRYVQKAIRIRNAWPVIARGTTEVVDELTGDDTAVWIRKDEKEQYRSVLIAVNTSDEMQTIELGSAAVTAGYGNPVGVLDAGDGSGETEIALNGTALTLNPFGIAVLTQ